MKIATWNINSVRLRLPLVLRLLQEQQPDVLCLQETKCPDEHFPNEAFAALGYAHLHISGMKSYNGVALISRIPLEAREVRHWCDKEDCRHAVASAPDGTEIHCLYVPAGGDIPDPEVNEKFAHKLRFVDELTGWWPSARDPERPMVLVGDLNIAPLETDVWSHKQLLGVVSHTPIEVEKLTRMQDSINWVDAVRHFVPPEERLYTWWSYRNKDWRASDRGRRLDHAWVTPALKPRLKSASVLKDMRDWLPPSDHVPVIIELDQAAS
jgi:exodeoxyribonuclease-3